MIGRESQHLVDKGGSAARLWVAGQCLLELPTRERVPNDSDNFESQNVSNVFSDNIREIDAVPKPSETMQEKYDLFLAGAVPNWMQFETTPFACLKEREGERLSTSQTVRDHG